MVTCLQKIMTQCESYIKCMNFSVLGGVTRVYNGDSLLGFIEKDC